MRHGKAFRKFSRTPAHRKALFRNMATELLRREQFETTVWKAKDLRPVVEKLITIAKEDNLHSRRKAYNYLKDKTVVHKLFADIGPRFKTRNGGYTRVVRTRVRVGDAAEMAVIELLK
jgi:large subunit ribosomal protein L17